MVERRSPKPQVAGSSPAAPAKSSEENSNLLISLIAGTAKFSFTHLLDKLARPQGEFGDVGKHTILEGKVHIYLSFYVVDLWLAKARSARRSRGSTSIWLPMAGSPNNCGSTSDTSRCDGGRSQGSLIRLGPRCSLIPEPHPLRQENGSLAAEGKQFLLRQQTNVLRPVANISAREQKYLLVASILGPVSAYLSRLNFEDRHPLAFRPIDRSPLIFADNCCESVVRKEDCRFDTRISEFGGTDRTDQFLDLVRSLFEVLSDRFPFPEDSARRESIALIPL